MTANDCKQTYSVAVHHHIAPIPPQVDQGPLDNRTSEVYLWGMDYRATIVKYLAKKQNSTCALCSERFTTTQLPSIDHIIPRIRGGSDEMENLQATHLICNIRKGAKLGLPAIRISRHTKPHILSSPHLKMPSLLEQARDLEMQGKTIKEISVILNLTREQVVSYLF